jgi:hypothetical protein
MSRSLDLDDRGGDQCIGLLLESLCIMRGFGCMIIGWGGV